MDRLSSKKLKVSDLVIQEIKRMVSDGTLRQGDKLPNQNEFSQQLGVSRPSLREALAQLTKMGIIKQNPGAGTILLTEHVDLWVDRPLPPTLADSNATLELTEARFSIEALTVDLATERINEEELAALTATIEKMKAALAQMDYRAYLDEDVNFHYQIANASHNRYLIHMFITIRGLMEQFIDDIFTHFPELVENSFEHHRKIFEAINARDKPSAINEIRNHIDDIRLSLMKYYAEIK